MVRRLLVVCTANVCRSAVAERMLARALSGRVDVDGAEWVVRSAGTASVRAPMDRHTVAAAAAVGLTLDGHVARHLSSEIIATDGADLVLTMTREHLRTVVGLDPSAWPRTFTLKEFARRASAIPQVGSDQGGFQAWRARLAEGRRAAGLMKPDPDDDVVDPYGEPRRSHDLMVETLSAEVGVIAARVCPHALSS
jgi:protein-tyrosine phosphatase